jgi:hypothetical protein
MPSEPASETVLGKGITLWGATATGKTTFLAALYTALLDQDTGWRLRGEDQGSTEALVTLTHTLADDGMFPGGTTGIRNYHWSLVGTVPRAIKEWHWYGLRRRDRNVVIPLELVDAAGEIADAGRVQSREITQRFVDNLANSTGIVFFFDPIREFERGDAFQHTFGVLAQLDSQMKRRGKLPHHVAVCVTKFDEQRVFDAAARMGMIDYDDAPPGFPRVPEEDARDFFARLCAVSRTRTAHRVLPLLEQTFDPSRIRFFVTSAIGFYVDRYSGMFDPQDYQQHIPPTIPDEEPRVRGVVRPINVVEPIVWLGKQLARTAG